MSSTASSYLEDTVKYTGMLCRDLTAPDTEHLVTGNITTLAVLRSDLYDGEEDYINLIPENSEGEGRFGVSKRYSQFLPVYDFI